MASPGGLSWDPSRGDGPFSTAGLAEGLRPPTPGTAFWEMLGSRGPAFWVCILEDFH